MSTRSVPVPDGPPLQQSIVRDISDRKRAEKALSESDLVYRQVVERSPFAILVVDGADVLYCNPEAVRMFGAATGAELTADRCWILSPPSNTPRLMSGYKALWRICRWSLWNAATYAGMEICSGPP